MLTIDTAMKTRSRIDKLELEENSSIFMTVKQWKKQRQFFGIKKHDQEEDETLGVTLTPAGFDTLQQIIPIINEDLKKHNEN